MFQHNHFDTHTSITLMSVVQQSFATYKENNTIEDGDLVVVYLVNERNGISIEIGQTKREGVFFLDHSV